MSPVAAYLVFMGLVPVASVWIAFYLKLNQMSNDIAELVLLTAVPLISLFLAARFMQDRKER